MPLVTGIALPQTSATGTQVGQLRSYLEFVDGAGFDSVWVTEQLFGPAARFDPLSLLAYAAGVTTRVRLGTAILLGVIHNPVLLAKTVASLDHLSGGRVSLGLGLGGDKSIYPAVGLDAAQRGRRLDLGIALMKRLWTDETVSDANDYWRIDAVRMEPKPVQAPHPPLLFGGSSAPALARAAREGQGWIGAGAASDARVLDELAALRELVARHNPDPDRFTYGKRVYLAIDENRDAARDKLRAWFGKTYWPRPPQAIDAVAVYGPVGYCLERLHVLAGAGINLLILNPVFDEAAHAELIAARLLPELRKA